MVKLGGREEGGREGLEGGHSCTEENIKVRPQIRELFGFGRRSIPSSNLVSIPSRSFQSTEEARMRRNLTR